MALFGLFGKRKEAALNWSLVAGNIASLLWNRANEDPNSITALYSRIVLRKDGAVFMATDKRDPKYLLGWGDISYVFLREDPEVLASWIQKLKNSTGSPPLQLIATEEFAKALTHTLMNTGYEAS